MNLVFQERFHYVTLACWGFAFLYNAPGRISVPIGYIVARDSDCTGSRRSEETLPTSASKGKHARLTLADFPTGYKLKPQVEEYLYMPESEHLVMTMADACGISTVPHALIRYGETTAYITKRVDRINENGHLVKRLHQYCDEDGIVHTIPLLYFTNLPKSVFSTEEIIELYSKRWDLEVTYKTLKTDYEWERFFSTDCDCELCAIYSKVLFHNALLSFMWQKCRQKIYSEDGVKGTGTLRINIDTDLTRVNIDCEVKTFTISAVIKCYEKEK